MFWEYVMDMSFVYATLIGGIIAIMFVFFKKRRTR